MSDCVPTYDDLGVELLELGECSVEGKDLGRADKAAGSSTEKTRSTNIQAVVRNRST